MMRDNKADTKASIEADTMMCEDVRPREARSSDALR
jgi:hypothetical protein